MKRYSKLGELLITMCMVMVIIMGCGTTGDVDVVQGTDELQPAEGETTEIIEVDQGEKLQEISGKQMKIVTTIFPVYDWVRTILGDHMEHVELSMLNDNGVDLHSYQATAEDIITIETCDLFIYVGGESDAWIEDVLANTTNSQLRVIRLMDVLGDEIKTEELVEGMQASEHNHDYDHEHEEEEQHDHDHEEAEEHDHHHDQGVEQDEHVWLSLQNAKLFCQAIATELAAIDTVNAATYAEYTTHYIAQLDELDQAYKIMVEDVPEPTILVADRFPYRYLVDDYQIEYYAAFVGCSAETEASFETVRFLADKIDELAITTVLTTESSDFKIANTVIASTKNQDQGIEQLDSMQSVTLEEIMEGTSYLTIMTENLGVLEKVLQ